MTSGGFRIEGDEPIDPKSLRRGFRPPQSFLYLDSLEGFESRLRAAA